MCCKNKFCCEQMQFHIYEKEKIIYYGTNFREYAIKVTINKNNDSFVLQDIKFCPFCGKKLPKDLRDEWFEELKKLDFDDPLQQNIPEEFKDDTWWKNRKL